MDNNSNGMLLRTAVTGGVVFDDRRKYIACLATTDTTITIIGGATLVVPSGEMWEPRLGITSAMSFDQYMVVITDQYYVPIDPSILNAFNFEDFNPLDFS